ncbi:ester cyclase [Mariniflexile gromovii]|uniref:Ester cyclase n=1 Tax=Mariniflexile gromovii TaxID=362523 RepID=A0ABS4BYE0_9FLAO|nr:ester cyclase [Mariniflexile gromovii]MBP0905051.1 ester cyclase [Mariniflexile gromovii]
MNKNFSNIQADKIILEFFNRVWGSSHDLKAIDELMTEDYVITTGGKTISGRDNFKKWVQTFQTKLTNAITISQEIIVSEKHSHVVSRFVCTGNNNGIFNLPPDNQPISFTGIAIWKIEKGKLKECWVERNAFEIYQDLISI